MSQAKHRHLVRNIPNTEENRLFIKKVNKISKQSDSIWKLFIKYRKPKEGFHYGSGGSLRCKNANAFSVYIDDRRPYSKRPENQYRTELWQENYRLKEENEKLKEELKFYKNPYNEWRVSEIEDEIFEVKQKIIEDFLRNFVSEDHRKIVQKKYRQLMEALEYHEKNND